MDKDRVEQIVKQSINQSIEGQDLENKKFDFKKEWYNLKDKKGINEFLKDTSSIANTFGLDGILVIGFDDGKNEFQESTFSNCGLKDKSQVYQLLVKRLSHPFDINIYDFDIDGHKISALHIPPAIEKPFLIKDYRTYHKDGNEKKREAHKTFVRKDAGTFPATKYDIDLMYYDRKNIIPDYRLIFDLLKVESGGIANDLNSIKLNIHLFLENLGKRSICIKQINLAYSPKQYSNETYTIHIDAAKRLDLGLKYYTTNFPLIQIVTNPNNGNYLLIEPKIEKGSNLLSVLDYWNSPDSEWEFLIVLSNGKSLTYKIKF